MNIKNTIDEYYEAWFQTNKIYNEWSKLKGLTPNEVFIISIINKNKICTQKIICDNLYLSKQTVNNILKNFLNQNYITKTIDKNNKREKLIRFTKKGKAYAIEIMDELNQFEQKIFSKLNSDERKTLVQINRILVNNLDKELKREKEQNYK